MDTVTSALCGWCTTPQHVARNWWMQNSWFEHSKDSCNNLPYWKGNKLRIVPISPSVVELLKTYLDKAHPTEQRQSDDYLFFTTHHGRKSRMSTDAVNLFMKNMVKWQGGLVLKCQNEYIHTNLGIPVPCICIVPGCRLSSSRSSLGMRHQHNPDLCMGRYWDEAAGNSKGIQGHRGRYYWTNMGKRWGVDKAPLWFGLILPHFNRVHNAATRS